ncbi:hypothetical protein BJ165DRAFT_1400626 [Panaeolus papilionaceus]|nr:hypothetical protein BJ165DRAFT_1400626 [Panaeolus papilionaceus]
MSGVKHISALDFMTFITKALRHPHKPTCCGGALTIALSKVPKDLYPPFVYEDDKVLSIKNRFHKTLYRFIVTNRHLDDNWMKQFSRCNDCIPLREIDCSPVSILCHRIWAQDHRQYTDHYLFFAPNISPRNKVNTYAASWSTFLEHATSILSRAITRGSDSFRTMAKGIRKRWPKKVSNLMPDGPDNAISTLIQWFCIYPQTTVSQFLVQIITLLRSHIYPSLVNFNFVAILMDATKATLDFLIKAFDQETRSQSEQAIVIYLFVKQSLTFIDFLLFYRSTYMSGDVKLLVMNGCETKALQLCSLLLCVRHFVAKHSNEYVAVEWQGAIAGCLVYREFNIGTLGPQMQYAVASPIIEADRSQFFGPLDDFEAEVGLGFIWNSGFDYGCFSKSEGCQKSFEIAGSNMKLCNRCLGVYYCGRKCQQDDWNDVDYPHSKICPLIVRIMDARPRAQGSTSTMQGRSNSLLRSTYRVEDVPILENIKAIRDMIIAANLAVDEMQLLKGWGRRIYHAEALNSNKVEYHPGYEDYDKVLKYLNSDGIYEAPGVAYFSTSPSTEIAKEKAILKSQPF